MKKLAKTYARKKASEHPNYTEYSARIVCCMTRDHHETNERAQTESSQ
jgi:hypothetical protein